MKILVANIGSTSLKHCLFECDDNGPRPVTRGTIERVTDYAAAIEQCLADLKTEGALTDESELAAVGFKPVLAKGVTGCVAMNEATLDAMAAYNGVAPAHNPPYIEGVRRFAQRLPDTPMIGLFETAFYQWMPEAATLYAVPAAWREAGLRRWGFHGASHKNVAEQSATALNRPDVAERVRRLYQSAEPAPVGEPATRVISCHLGGSSSVAGIRSGLAVGASMGLSPQSGLPQNNRVGDLDSMAIPFLVNGVGLDLAEVERAMAKESGLLGLSGVSNDVRDIRAAAADGNTDAQRAMDYFVYWLRHWIGAYMIELGGVDALVFTAGIGENDAELRSDVCEGLGGFGLNLDPDANTALGKDAAVAEIQMLGSPAKILVVQADEERVIAEEVWRKARGSNSGSVKRNKGVAGRWLP